VTRNFYNESTRAVRECYIQPGDGRKAGELLIGLVRCRCHGVMALFRRWRRHREQDMRVRGPSNGRSYRGFFQSAIRDSL